jgi:hypothetical protein
VTPDPLPRLREICLSLPEATEKISHGSPTWFVRKSFVSYVPYHHGSEHLAFWCAAPPGVQEELVAEEPGRFFRPPYVGHRGWLGVILDVERSSRNENQHEGELAPDWEEISEIVTDAYRCVAPKKLIAVLDSDS